MALPGWSEAKKAKYSEVVLAPLFSYALATRCPVLPLCMHLLRDARYRLTVCCYGCATVCPVLREGMVLSGGRDPD
eukprot:2676758-Rhodomonas_salina.1